MEVCIHCKKESPRRVVAGARKIDTIKAWEGLRCWECPLKLVQNCLLKSVARDLSFNCSFLVTSLDSENMIRCTLGSNLQKCPHQMIRSYLGDRRIEDQKWMPGTLTWVLQLVFSSQASSLTPVQKKGVENSFVDLWLLRPLPHLENQWMELEQALPTAMQLPQIGFYQMWPKWKAPARAHYCPYTIAAERGRARPWAPSCWLPLTSGKPAKLEY